jgi:hypothetical protein
MFNALKTATIAGLVGLTALAAVPAKADSIYLGLGGNGGQVDVYRSGVSARVYRRDRYRDEYRDDQYRDDQYRDDEFRRDDYRRDEFRRSERGCSPERALYKAQRIGLHRARIVDVSRRTISVAGRSRGDRVTVTFARAPSCPIIG